MTASVVRGSYRLVARATDLPVFVMAAAGERAPDPTVAATARLSIAAGADPAARPDPAAKGHLKVMVDERALLE